MGILMRRRRRRATPFPRTKQTAQPASTTSDTTIIVRFVQFAQINPTFDLFRARIPMLPFLVIECGHELVKLFPLSVNIGGRQHGLLAKQNNEEFAKFILVKLLRLH